MTATTTDPQSTSLDTAGDGDEKPFRPVPFADANQQFLVGETIYLRALEPGDGKHPTVWRDARFPVNADKAEELIKKDLDSKERYRTVRLLACRRVDDRPVGVATYSTWNWCDGEASVYADPAFGDAAHAYQAEMLGLIVPWLLDERDLMAVWVSIPGNDRVLVEAAGAIEMHQAACLREALWVNGHREDQLTFEGLNRGWQAKLGTPEPGITVAGAPDDPRRRFEGAPSAIFRQPAGDPPKDAVMVGDRVYLRAYTDEDARRESTWNRQETETFFDNGRAMWSAHELTRWNRGHMDEDPAEWVRFAIVLKESGEFIGSNGIADIDWVHKTAETESFIPNLAYRGGGYGSEAKHLLLAYSFERIGLHAVRSFVWGPNTRSQAALRKQGYRDAGRFNWTGRKNAEWTHDMNFDLLASEWRERVGGR